MKYISSILSFFLLLFLAQVMQEQMIRVPLSNLLTRNLACQLLLMVDH
ncbi:hypothetical protein [Bacillus coahuilensis]|nr:hypothetical protein [Bacillus coahuilensis]